MNLSKGGGLGTWRRCVFGKCSVPGPAISWESSVQAAPTGYLDTHGERDVRCAAQGASNRIPYASWVSGFKTSLEILGRAHQLSESLCGPQPPLHLWSSTFRISPSLRTQQGVMSYLFQQSPPPRCPLKWVEWQDRAVRGSLRETWATDPSPSRSLRRKK